MSNYTISQGESITDVVINSTGDISNYNSILDANGFTTWTPNITVGQVVLIPDTVTYNNNVLNEIEFSKLLDLIP